MLASSNIPASREPESVRQGAEYRIPPYLLAQCEPLVCSNGHRVIVLDKDGFPLKVKYAEVHEVGAVEKSQFDQAENQSEAKP
jgi:hypothetical protein